MLKINLRDKIKSLNTGQLVYSGTTLLYFAVLIVIFIFAARFLARSLDRAFVLDEAAVQAQITSLDLQSYQLLAKKLNLSLASADTAPELIASSTESGPASSTATSTAIENIAATTTPAAATSSSASAAESKEFKIAVFNSTNKAGLAGDLKKTLSAAGFPVAKIGSLTPAAKTTTIKIKASANKYLTQIDAIKKAVADKYSAVTTVLSESSSYDIEIVIGNK